MAELISRREALKRGFKYGGAVVFVTPVVNVLGMAAAGATSGGSSYGDDRRSRGRDQKPKDGDSRSRP